MRVAGILFVVCLCNACGVRQHKTGWEDSVRQYLRLAVALGERDPNSLDYYYGPAEWVADIRSNPPPLDEIKRSAFSLIERLKSDSAAGVGASRVEYLIAQLQAIAARADLLTGVHHSFDEEAEALFGMSASAATNNESLADVRAVLEQMLPGHAPLAQRYAAYDNEFVVPQDRLPAALARSFQGCRQRTLEHMELPPAEEVKIEYVRDKPWNAYSNYQGRFRSVIQINADFPLTVDRALQLACHEGYPGHHAYNSIQDAQLVQREGRTELMAQPTFSPQSFASEAAATVAVDVAFPEADRLRFEREELFPLAGLDKTKAERYFRVQRLVNQLESTEGPIARDYLDGRLEFVRAASALEQQALMTHAEATLKYINEFRTYTLTYTLGKNLAGNCLAKAGANQWTVFRKLVLSRMAVQDCAKWE